MYSPNSQNRAVTCLTHSQSVVNWRMGAKNHKAAIVTMPQKINIKRSVETTSHALYGLFIFGLLSYLSEGLTSHDESAGVTNGLIGDKYVCSIGYTIGDHR